MRLPTANGTLTHELFRMTLYRIRNSAVLSAAVFPDDTESAHVPMPPDTARAIAAQVRVRDERSSEFLELHRELTLATRDLDALRAENATLMHDNRAAMRELKQLREANVPAPSQLSEDADAAAASGLERELKVNVILRNIFQVNSPSCYHRGAHHFGLFWLERMFIHLYGSLSLSLSLSLSPCVLTLCVNATCADLCTSRKYVYCVMRC